jgi:hypothetical protein
MPKPSKKVEHVAGEVMPIGYDVSKASGNMNEHQHLNDVKAEVAKGDVQYKSGEKSDPKNPKPEE